MKIKNKFLLPVFILLISIQSTCLFGQDNKLWLMGGQNLNNTRNASFESKITPKNAGNLVVKWAFTTGGDVSATPTVDDKYVYFPDWAGNLYKVDANTGVQVWKKEMKDYIPGQTFSFARATPAIAGNALIIGTQLGNPASGAYVHAINKQTGQLLWSTRVDNHPAAIITQSAVVSGNRVYVGVASQEEGFAADPNYPCCSFRGSLVCLDVKSGNIIWQTYMAPNSEKGFFGNAVWGSTPVIDSKRNSVYIATGNNYKVPQAVLDCNAPGRTPEQVRACVMAQDGSSQNYFDAIVSLDLNTGAVKWATSVIPFDAWNVGCFFEGDPTNCPDNAGPDYDFGQGPALFTAGKQELLGAGQKSGIYWTLNPDNGAIVWHTQVGPGSTLGGLQWGSAVDGKRVYTAVSNFSFIPHEMTTGPGAGTTVQGGFWAALDAATGQRIWENAGNKPPAGDFPPGLVAVNTGMVSVANGVVFAGALDAVGTMYAFEASTGKKLWSFESGGSINSGPAIVDGSVYWGSGYSNFGLGTANNKLYAFKIGSGNNLVSSATESNIKKVDYVEWASIAPNPIVKNKANLTITGEKGKMVTWRLVNLQGAYLKSGKFNAVSDNDKQELDLSNLASGNYFIMLESGRKRTVIKVINPE